MLIREYRLKDTNDFQRVFTNGKSFANRCLVLYYIPYTDQESFRVGFSVSKKLGNAVVRNRVKRLLRESVRLLHNDKKIELKGFEFIVIARISSTQLSLDEMMSNLMHLFSKCGFAHHAKV